MSHPDFIFMLTRNDRTVAGAAEYLETALEAGVRHIGFKDIGQPVEELARLNQRIKAAGASSYLEVVSQDLDSELTSVRVALDLGVDYLLGGTHVDEVLPLLAGSRIRYYPFPGEVYGHPSILGGTLEEIVASARRIGALPGVHGLDLLAYRASVDVPMLMAEVCRQADVPVIMAGSIDTTARIQIVRDAGAAGFTVGTAALDERFPAPRPGLLAQLKTILAAAS
ncbi:4-hydroxythreonine-4-phosphate dehydrogenase [Achromobacter sp. AONIH1]|uniref:4-hydroxythreonine-4-phosphate dehydrogenase n=1 Tax=unclassified Achromobacter TaxID=2626865 RepID=UPI000CD14EB7|nr:4-hydroxythreonine-4-phosphate dehydrogenase [Achromobacter sp. AONIH1]AUT49787.1 4-hydroxythreonine-4-phosphate dehydrogenase [Achromobacter sp. AONIH1]